tara:strand:+ start:3826 stop:4605 length:780 start_codon:yes stop_codon:yes gene_type:complete
LKEISNMKYWMNEPINESMIRHFKDFKETFPTIAKCSDSLNIQKQYFDGKINGEFNWNWHGEILSKIQLHTASKDISILDIGTQFGFVPHFLKEYGFTDVDCTNSLREAGSTNTDLETVWKEMGIEPYDLHINANEEFVLNKKYDLILITSTNALWNNSRLVQFANNEIKNHNYVVDKDGESHTFIVPFNIPELKYFIDNVKKYLTDDGIAVVQPMPFPYLNVGFEKERELIEDYQKIGHWDVTEYNAARDYFTIMKTK